MVYRENMGAVRIWSLSISVHKSVIDLRKEQSVTIIYILGDWNQDMQFYVDTTPTTLLLAIHVHTQ